MPTISNGPFQFSGSNPETWPNFLSQDKVSTDPPKSCIDHQSFGDVLNGHDYPPRASDGVQIDGAR